VLLARRSSTMNSDGGSSIRIEHLVPGGFHRVYRLAMYQNTTVVVKQVNAQSDNDVDQFHKEVALLNQVSYHPSIINLIGWSVSNFGGTVFGLMFMEHAAGGDLLERLKARGAFCEDDVRYCCHHIGSAIAHCHHRGIVHRDIKLENIALQGTSINHGLRLIDFGLAEDTSIPSAAISAGTTAYRAPFSTVDGMGCLKKADVWCFGITLFAIIHAYMPMSEACPTNRRFERFRTACEAGMGACDAIYSTLPTNTFRPCLSESMMQLLNSMLLIDHTTRAHAQACVDL